MLQRFPVESKGRRKKLQEVIKLQIFFFPSFVSKNGFFFYVYLDTGLYVACAGWLCDDNMLFVFPHQMCDGEPVLFYSASPTSEADMFTYYTSEHM